MIKKLALGCLGILLSVNTAFALNEKHTAKILETKDAGGYTYIKVDEKGEQYWAAVLKTPVKVGQEITFLEQVWMKNFRSKALDQTFDKIMFAELPQDKSKMMHGHGAHGAKDVHVAHGIKEKDVKQQKKPDVKFNDGIIISKETATKVSISSLYEQKEKFKNKNVIVQGHVIQVSNKVMGNTWVKIYDGKDSIIFRSPNEDEKIAVGDEVKVIGTINTDIDFGHGYKYEVLGVNGKFEILN